MNLFRDRLAELLREAGDFVFPPCCEFCGESSPDAFRLENGKTSIYCRTCRVKIAPEIQFACTRCAAELGPYSNGDGSCVHCRQRKFKFDTVVCLGMYQGFLKQALLSAKWSITRVNIQSLAELLCEKKADELRELNCDEILPIPQYWRQRVVRHFNPALLVARTVASFLEKPLNLHLLRRSRATLPQKRVSVAHRFANQLDAFEISETESLKKKRFLLVDDVLTTGATCSEAASLLRKNGAAGCDVAVIARVLDHSA